MARVLSVRDSPKSPHLKNAAPLTVGSDPSPGGMTVAGKLEQRKRELRERLAISPEHSVEQAPELNGTAAPSSSGGDASPSLASKVADKLDQRKRDLAVRACHRACFECWPSAMRPRVACLPSGLGARASARARRFDGACAEVHA